jgi:hypothetical protein
MLRRARRPEWPHDSALRAAGHAAPAQRDRSPARLGPLPLGGQPAGCLRDGLPWTARVTAADNGSTDGTWAVARSLAAALSGEVRRES